MTLTQQITVAKSAYEALAAQDRAYCKTHCEGRTDWSPMREKADAALMKYVSLMEQEKSQEWTVEIYNERKLTWNEWVKTMSANGKITHAMVVEKEKSLRWKLDDLKAAKSRLGL